MNASVSDRQPDEAVWGAKGIGLIVNRSPSQTVRMLEAGLLPGKKVGRIWQSTVGALRAAMRVEAA
jgi:hypothetical protein